MVGRSAGVDSPASLKADLLLCKPRGAIKKEKNRVISGVKWPLGGLSRMSGNYHVRFLGGKGAVKPLTYPVKKCGWL